jgi:microcystin-dependent protein
MSDQYIGEIRMVGFNFAPVGWALCQGQLLPIMQYNALFALLGTTYGGNGQTTFGLPDYRGRSPVGMGAGPGLTPINQGEMSGAESVVLSAAQLPAHSHAAGTIAIALGASSGAGSTSNPAGAVPANASDNQGITLSSFAASGNALLAPGTAQGQTAAAGNSQPTPLRNPFIGINFIIALEGEFPSRS